MRPGFLPKVFISCASCVSWLTPFASIRLRRSSGILLGKFLPQVENPRSHSTQSRNHQPMNDSFPSYRVCSRAEWLAERQTLLAREKALTRENDALAAARRQLPWVAVEKPYTFNTPNGPATLGDLFDGRSQLLVYHFMFGPGWEE